MAMSDFRLRTLAIVHQWVRAVIERGDTVIDATVGNGHDTLFLSQEVGEKGSVIGFDIQDEAVCRTREALSKRAGLGQVDLYVDCHSNMKKYCQDEVGVVMFNLGYLPKGDKSIITEEKSTLAALEASLSLLKPGGLVTIMCYPGHAGGADEAGAVERWAATLETPEYLVMRLSPHNPKSPAPYLIAVQKNTPRKFT